MLSVCCCLFVDVSWLLRACGRWLSFEYLRCSLFVACCWLIVVALMLLVVCCSCLIACFVLLFVVCVFDVGVCRVLFVVCCLSFLVNCGFSAV